MEDLKFNMSFMKTHDYHVIMTQLIPIAIRGVLLVKKREPITKLCSFFNAISHKVIDPLDLKMLQEDLIHIVTQLEMHLPPTIFGMSVHLVIHLVTQIQQLGPIFLRRMLPFKWLMSVLRKYVRNKYMHMLVFLICILDNSASAQNIPLQHFTREYSKVLLFILSQGKAIARNDNK